MSIRKNTLLNLIGAIIPMVVMLVTVPLYLNLLGEVRYGVLALVWVVLGYFSFFEMGLGKATSNQIAKTNEIDVYGRAEIFWTAISVNLAMGVVGASVLWFVGNFLINHALEISEDFRSEALNALPWMVAAFPLALLSSVLNGTLEGRNQFRVLTILQINNSVAFQIVPLLFAWLLGPSLKVVITVAVLTRAFMSLLYLRACHRTVPLVGRPSPSRSRVRLLFTYGGWVAITSATVPLLDTIDRFIIGIFAGPTSVTYYTVSMQLVGKIKVIPGALSRAMFPVLSSCTAGDAARLAHSLLRSLSVGMTILVLVSLLVLRPFLEFWVGVDIANIAAPLGELLLIGIWFNAISHIPYFLLQAQGKPSLVAKVHMFELPIYIAGAWIAMQWFGLTAVAMVWVLRCGIEFLVLLSVGALLSTSAYLLVMQTTVLGYAVYLLHSAPDIEIVTRALIMIPLLFFGSWAFYKIFRSTYSLSASQ